MRVVLFGSKERPRQRGRLTVAANFKRPFRPLPNGKEMIDNCLRFSIKQGNFKNLWTHLMMQHRNSYSHSSCCCNLDGPQQGNDKTYIQPKIIWVRCYRMPSLQQEAMA